MKGTSTVGAFLCNQRFDLDRCEEQASAPFHRFLNRGPKPSCGWEVVERTPASGTPAANAVPGLLNTLPSTSPRVPLCIMPSQPSYQRLLFPLWLKTGEERVGEIAWGLALLSPRPGCPTSGCVACVSRGASLGLSFLIRKMEGFVPTTTTAFQ